MSIEGSRGAEVAVKHLWQGLTFDLNPLGPDHGHLGMPYVAARVDYRQSSRNLQISHSADDNHGKGRHRKASGAN